MSNVKAVIVRSGNEEYALPVENVISIEKLESINPIPHLPDYMLGLMKIRGELVPVLDLEQILYNRKAPQNDVVRVVVVQTDSLNIGLLVLDAKEILDLPEDTLKQIGLSNYSRTKFVSSVANLENRMITLIDPTVLVTTLEGVKEIKEYMDSVES
ncbi:chemotaxis protein CheW [Chungangia koreensis]|uniref:Chemotaxis protein CheW n=1 Tax=Chungangia koreensis TaxID=752657 RepID=A0ABV8X7P2_9LACT